MDRIHIRDLIVRCMIGVSPEERSQRQAVVLNIVLETDLSAGAGTDRIEDTLNYKVINRGVIGLVEGSECSLIETLAERVAEHCLAYEGITRVTVTVDKPGALRMARSVGAEITRPR